MHVSSIRSIYIQLRDMPMVWWLYIYASLHKEEHKLQFKDIHTHGYVQYRLVSLITMVTREALHSPATPSVCHCCRPWPGVCPCCWPCVCHCCRPWPGVRPCCWPCVCHCCRPWPGVSPWQTSSRYSACFTDAHPYTMFPNLYQHTIHISQSFPHYSFSTDTASIIKVTVYFQFLFHVPHIQESAAFSFEFLTMAYNLQPIYYTNSVSFKCPSTLKHNIIGFMHIFTM